MLNFNQGGFSGTKEAPMTAAQSQMKTSSEQLTRLVQSSPVQGRRFGINAPEEALSYSWPIGTTRAVKDRVATSRRKEECPPEVYIG
jgi:hypothetical protein